MQKRPILITFSGLDGSGKSTQIEELRAMLGSWCKEVRVLAFWDDIVAFARYREGFVHRVYKSERGIGTPERPVQRRDKNVRRWYLTLARHLLYLLDGISLRWVIGRLRRSGPEVIVLDRYIYDELANLPLSNLFSRRFAIILSNLVPRPAISFLLDVDPEVAVARKPEYPLEFMNEARKSYFALAGIVGNMTIIPPQSIDMITAQIRDTVTSVIVDSSKLSTARIENSHVA